VVTLEQKADLCPAFTTQNIIITLLMMIIMIFTVAYEPGKPVKHPNTGREMTIYERYDIYLYTVDGETRQMIKTLYTVSVKC
jgi:hypothetical protein